MRLSRPALRLAVVLAFPCLFVAGCFGDPPQDPDEAPLEVVVDGRQRPDEPCQLNRSEVGAGTHDITVIAEGGPAAVRIRDTNDAVVLEVQRSPGAPADARSVRLSEGIHTVECLPTGGMLSTATLRIVPAA